MMKTVVNRLLYLHAREFASGHGVSVGWETPVEGTGKTTSVFTEFIPTHEVPTLIAPADEMGAASLDMKVLGRNQES